MKLSDILSVIFLFDGVLIIYSNTSSTFYLTVGSINIVIGIVGFIAGRYSLKKK